MQAMRLVKLVREGLSVEQSAAVGRSVSGEGVRHVRFGPVPEAAEHLETLVGLWQAGQVAPLPLLPGSAMAYVAALRDGVDAEKALGKARTVLSGARYKGYGDWGPYAAAVWGDTDPLAPDASVAGDFLAVAEAVMGPLLDHLEEA